ncbi:MAG: magnesium transporter CorA family protein [Hydrocarboniphaga effusa]|nr:magnesium transporter CorA family protein [Hydrocarboniphaga effusa]
MQIFQFGREGGCPAPLKAVERLPEDGFIWLDFKRDEAGSWPAHVEPLVEVSIHDNHVHDSFNGNHPSYFDVTSNYDMLIFQGLIADYNESEQNLIETKSASFFIFDHLLVSVHAEDNVSFDIVKRKFGETKLRFPSTPVGLVYSLLDTMVDRYMTITDEMERRLERVQNELLDPKNPFEDWRELLDYRKQAHDLELICEQNLLTLDAWKREMRLEISEKQRTRLHDLCEHIQRVQSHGDSLQKDIEVAVQLHFASVTHRTNEIVRTLTVLSAIFLPLTFIAGVYGMNFEFMPELGQHWGYPLTLLFMASVAVALLMFFRRRRYF